MLEPHAILLSRRNFDAILTQTNCFLEQLDMLWEDSLEEGKSYYIVHKRNEEGLPYCEAMSKDELEKEFNVIVDKQFDLDFARI